ncbi:hypothetical protein FKX85_17285 [Echinicola soli]|uniref:SH3 domain-containing protein n=1 Tax=Echinicola soli TaxID=2591634 RepID=A0A514CLM2_9BACT|nr:hypothetical protein [Echinicola soli]QDH80698.1 hypothetical protein FKX85_17285 [Echinicola soli]
MRILNIIFLLTFISCQSQNCDCEGFIDWESDKIINIYSDSNGKTKIAELHNDLINDDFLIFRILESNKNYFKVEIGRAMTENRITGWIKKIKEIVVDDRNYSDSQTLNLYTEPNLESKIKNKITEYSTEHYTIKNCKGKWIYAHQVKDGEVIEGWLEPSMQCPNPYTTCN